MTGNGGNSPGNSPSNEISNGGNSWTFPQATAATRGATGCNPNGNSPDPSYRGPELPALWGEDQEGIKS